MLGVVLLLVSTAISQAGQDYTRAVATTKEAIAIELGVPKMLSKLEGYGKTLAYSITAPGVVDAIIFVSMTAKNKQLIIQGVKSPMLTKATHNLECTRNSLYLLTVWRF